MARMPSLTTIAWGVAFGFLAIALATRFAPVNDAVAGDLPLNR